MDLWAFVSLDQHLNGPMHGSFAVVLYLRIEWWVIIVLSFRLTQYYAQCSCLLLWYFGLLLQSKQYIVKFMVT